MFLTKPQLNRFWREWSRVVDYNGWDHTRAETERKAVLSRAGFTSLTLVDRTDGFDRLLAELGALQDLISKAAELCPAGQDRGYRRRLLWLIKKHASPLGGVVYVKHLARDKFHLTTGLNSIDDLTTDQLHQLMITLNARARSARLKNESITSEETFPDECEFAPDPGIEQEALTPF